MVEQKLAVSAADIERAAVRIEGYAVRTPLLENPALNDRVGARILMKPECLQRTGSFKFRGAYNRLAQLSETERGAGVVAWSSGNHAQGVAAAAQMPATLMTAEEAETATGAGRVTFTFKS